MDGLKAETDAKGKTNPTFEVLVTNEEGEAVARVTKVLSVRRKDRVGNEGKAH